MARPELTARLNGDYRLGLVSAPAGYGKTAALASWAAERRDSVAWLSCDALDAEPTRFMSGLLTAISARWPGVADDAFVLLERTGANTYDPAVAVANELAELDAGGVVVIDDLHLAAPAPTVLSAFVEALPAGFQLVAGTRSDPPLSLGRLRLRGDLLELRGDDLRFAAAELSEFFGLQDITIDQADLEQLHELTEGWPAGAQLAAIALRRRRGRGDFLGAFASTDRGVADFLLSDVLAGLAPELVEFLIETSVLEAFDAELCAAVTGVDDSAAILERLFAANLFLVELDDPPRWFRYHHLFAAFLRARLASQGSSRLRAVHDRASRAVERGGHVDEALRHAMATNDVDRVGQILRDALTRSMSVSGGADEVVRALRLWLHELGAAAVETDPALLVEFVIGLISVSHPDDVATWLDRVQHAHPDADGQLAALIEGAWSQHHDHRGQPLEAIRRLGLALDAVGGTPPSVGLLALLYTATARAHLHAGQIDQARSLLGHARAHPVGHPVADDVRNPALEALVAAGDGELTAATDLVRSAEEAADRRGLERHEMGRIYAGLATIEVHLQRGDPASARELVDDLRAAAEMGRFATIRNDVILQQAQVARILGDEAEADALLTQARLAYAAPDAAMRHVFGEEAVAQALRFDPTRAASLIAELDGGRSETRVLMARHALLEDDDRRAAELLAALPPARTRRARVERSVLCALSVLARDVDAANRHLEAALVGGQPEWLIGPIIELGPEVHQLLMSYTPNAAQEPYVDALLARASRGVAPLRTAVNATFVEQLSAREVTVLRYLCTRLTYREIAAALYVSINTLKSHVRTVYRKLEVASRADAVIAGRRAGLI